MVSLAFFCLVDYSINCVHTNQPRSKEIKNDEKIMEYHFSANNIYHVCYGMYRKWRSNPDGR